MNHTQSTKRRAPRMGRAVLVTSLLTLMGTAPALADHTSYGRPSYGVTGRVDGRIGGLRFGYRSARVSDCDSQLEYERGFDRGRRRGYDVGYRHGSSGRAFCGTPARDLRRDSRYFIQGYLEAYGRAYADGFRRGRAACGAPAHHRRW